MTHEFFIGQLVTFRQSKASKERKEVMEVVSVTYRKGQDTEFSCLMESGVTRPFFAQELTDYKPVDITVCPVAYEKYVDAVQLSTQYGNQHNYGATKEGFEKYMKDLRVWADIYLLGDQKNPHSAFAEAMNETRQEAKVRCYQLMYLAPFLHEVMETAAQIEEGKTTVSVSNLEAAALEKALAASELLKVKAAAGSISVEASARALGSALAIKNHLEAARSDPPARSGGMPCFVE